MMEEPIAVVAVLAGVVAATLVLGLLVLTARRRSDDRDPE